MKKLIHGVYVSTVSWYLINVPFNLGETIHIDVQVSFAPLIPLPLLIEKVTIT